MLHIYVYMVNICNWKIKWLQEFLVFVLFSFPCISEKFQNFLRLYAKFPLEMRQIS